MIEHRPPFLVDYVHDGRSFSFILEGPGDWADAEAHLRSIRVNSIVIGGSAEVFRTNVLVMWIDGPAVWLKAKWRNWRRA